MLHMGEVGVALKKLCAWGGLARLAKAARRGAAAQTATKGRLGSPAGQKRGTEGGLARGRGPRMHTGLKPNEVRIATLSLFLSSQASLSQTSWRESIMRFNAVCSIAELSH